MAAVVASLGLFAALPQGPGPAGTVTAAAEAPAAYQVVEVRDGGTIEGEVRFAGPLPVLEPIPVEPRHQAACGQQVPNEALVVSPRSRGVRSAVVYLESVAKGKAPGRREPAVIENRNCLFVPHVGAAMVGDPLLIRNADPVLHNIRGRMLEDRRQHFNVVQPTRGQETEREVRRVGVTVITCDTHPHMLGYLLAFEHPYYAVTDDEGRFRLEGVPPGRYRLVAWHEGWVLKRLDRGRPLFDDPQQRVQEVTVEPHGTVTVRFELPASPR